MTASSTTGIGTGSAFPTFSNNKSTFTIDNLSKTTNLTQYLVGNNSKYKSIQSAIDQAVEDGKNSSNPAVVIVKPGTYAEDLTMASGVHVTSISPISHFSTIEPTSSTILQGSVNVNLTEPSSAIATTSFSGISIYNESGYGITFRGSNQQKLVLESCSVFSKENNLFVENTNSSSVIFIGDIAMKNLNGNVGINTDSSSQTLIVINRLFFGDWVASSDDVAVSTNGGTVIASEVRIAGQVTVGSSASTTSLSGSVQTITVPCFVLDSPAGGLVLSNMTVGTSDTHFASGTGLLLTGVVTITPPGTATIESSITHIPFTQSFIPSTPGNWSPAPTDIASALNQIAARLTAGSL